MAKKARAPEESWEKALASLVQARPIVFLRIPADEAEQLAATRDGMSEFTLTRPHDELREIQTPCLGLIFAAAPDGLRAYAAVLKSRGPVSTLVSRIKVKRSSLIKLSSPRELVKMVEPARQATDLRKRLDSKTTALKLAPKLSVAVLDALLAEEANHGPLRSVAAGLIKPARGTIVELQADAVETALKAFGLTSDAPAVSLQLAAGKKTSLDGARVMEDSVIEHDARSIPGYDLVASDVTGRATFRRDDQTLEVFTANRKKLEETFGVDLIYFNELHQCIVMVQYKMLEPSGKESGTDWVYREDAHLKKQLRTMALFAKSAPSGGMYRLNREAFYFKFVRRLGPTPTTNVLLPLEHFSVLLADKRFRTRKNGVKVTYSDLDGHFMRQTAFFSLLQSGYIGAEVTASQNLRQLVESVLEDNDAVVLAVQRLTSDEEREEDRDRIAARYSD